MTMHAQSPIRLKDVSIKKRELEVLIADALNHFYDQTGLSVDSISIEAVQKYGQNSLTVNHIVFLEVKL